MLEGITAPPPAPHLPPHPCCPTPCTSLLPPRTRRPRHPPLLPLQVDREVREASSLLRFMRRWCCFQCWDCCDPTVQQDRTRATRVAA